MLSTKTINSKGQIETRVSFTSPTQAEADCFREAYQAAFVRAVTVEALSYREAVDIAATAGKVALRTLNEFFHH